MPLICAKRFTELSILSFTIAQQGRFTLFQFIDEVAETQMQSQFPQSHTTLVGGRAGAWIQSFSHVNALPNCQTTQVPWTGIQSGKNRKFLIYETAVIIIATTTQDYRKDSTSQVGYTKKLEQYLTQKLLPVLIITVVIVIDMQCSLDIELLNDN